MGIPFLNLRRQRNKRAAPARACLRAHPSAEAPRSGAPHVMHIVTSAMTVGLMRQQLRYLREAGFRVTLVSGPGDDIDRVARDEGVAKATVPMEREISPLHDVRSLWLLWRLLRRDRPAIVNVGTAKAGLLAGLAAWLSGVPCRIYTLHGIRLETTTGWKRALLLCAERISCRCAHRVLCVSKSVQRRAVELALCEAPRSLFLGAGSFNGVDADHFAPTPENQARAAALRRELGLPQEAPVVGFVGRLVRDKGIAELVEAFQLLRRRAPEARLLLLGRWETADPVSPEARAFIESDPGVVHVGHVSDPVIYYQAMDVLALPTYREGFPTVVLEASACGKPVVTTEATGAIDAVEDGVTGLVVPVGDAARLAEAFVKLVEDPAFARKLGAAGRERVRQEFATERVCRELAGLYRDLLAANGARDGGAVDEPTFSRASLAVKRACDLCGAAARLALAGPVMAVAALAVWATMGTPVLFRQRRAGRGGKAFTLLKFRTMTNARDGRGRLLPDAARLHPMGRLLRRLSIDELPQLWNVWRGEMSLVGPRPLLVEYLPAYTAREQLRHAVAPGLTGHAQIRGREALLFSARLELDAWYVEHWSLGLDLRIFLRTIPQLFRAGGETVCHDLPAVDDRGFWRYLTHIPTEDIGRGHS